MILATDEFTLPDANDATRDLDSQAAPTAAVVQRVLSIVDDMTLLAFVARPPPARSTLLQLLPTALS